MNPCAEFRNILIENGACIQSQSPEIKDQHKQYSSLSLTNLLSSATSSLSTSINSSISPNDSSKSAKKKNSLNNLLAAGSGAQTNSSKNLISTSFSENSSKLNNSLNSSHSTSPLEKIEKAQIKKVKLRLIIYNSILNLIIVYILTK